MWERTERLEKERKKKKRKEKRRRVWWRVRSMMTMNECEEEEGEKDKKIMNDE